MTAMHSDVNKQEQTETTLEHFAKELMQYATATFGDEGGLRLGESPSSAELENLYALGHGHYQQNRYMDAARVFWTLLRHDCTEAKYYKAIAACMLMLQQFQAAAMSYGMAAILDTTDSTSLFYLGQCFCAVRSIEQAHEALDEFLLRTSTTMSQHSALRAQARALLNAIETDQVDIFTGGK
jgi:type III secretion system low calcium response chaperone LcrH/SycD